MGYGDLESQGIVGGVSGKFVLSLKKFVFFILFFKDYTSVPYLFYTAERACIASHVLCMLIRSTGAGLEIIHLLKDESRLVH